MSLPVIFRAAALADVEQAYAWYEERLPGLGRSFMDELEKIHAHIQRNPQLFGKVRGPVRRAILRKFPYGVFYIVDAHAVSVIAVLHHARAPHHWQRRSTGH